MLTDRMDDLKSIMNDNATFIDFPPIGSSTSLITILGDNKVNIQRTIRSIMQLVRLSFALTMNLLMLSLGLPILRGLPMASSCSIQRSSPSFDTQSRSHDPNTETNL